jgi:hypothetical protein
MGPLRQLPSKAYASDEGQTESSGRSPSRQRDPDSLIVQEPGESPRRRIARFLSSAEPVADSGLRRNRRDVPSGGDDAQA